MACPTCDHTMHLIGKTHNMNSSIFWCPRCGTIKNDNSPTDVPKLVVEARLLCNWIRTDLANLSRRVLEQMSKVICSVTLP